MNIIKHDVNDPRLIETIDQKAQPIFGEVK
jgi:hypothetical protein